MEFSTGTMDIMRSFTGAIGMMMVLAAIMAIIMNRLNADADEETVAQRNRRLPYIVSLMIPLVIVIIRPHVYISLMLIIMQVMILIITKAREQADSKK